MRRKVHVADQNYSRSERFSQNGHKKSPLAVATGDIRASQMLLASVGDFISRTRPSAVEARTRPERRRQVARRPCEGGRPILGRWLPGRRGDMAGGLYLLTPARGAPRPCTVQPPFVLAVLSPQNELKRRPQGAG